jgi:hypothetical protein
VSSSPYLFLPFAKVFENFLAGGLNLAAGF